MTCRKDEFKNLRGSPALRQLLGLYLGAQRRQTTFLQTADIRETFLRPSSLSWQSVCGRLSLKPFQICTRPFHEKLQMAAQVAVGQGKVP